MAQRILNELTKSQYEDLIPSESSIIVSTHALDHLSDGQRKILDATHLIKPLITEKPAFAGYQENDRYALFFRRKEGFLKIIVKKKRLGIEIITFMNVASLPEVK